MSDELQILANAIAAGSDTTSEAIGEAIKGLFGSRFHKRSASHLEHDRPPFIRNAYGRNGAESEHVAYAGFINPDNPPWWPSLFCAKSFSTDGTLRHRNVRLHGMKASLLE